ncbi:MAG TPA: histidine kinase dimerization/phospho-acceptor domain-containing protein, partial [Terriglobales bacterium]
MSVLNSNSAQRSFREPEILHAQIQLLYGNAQIAAAVTLFAAGLLSALEWPVIRHPIVLGWFAGMCVVASCRYVVARRYSPASAGVGLNERWRMAAAFGAGLAGFGWGAAGILLYPESDLTRQVLLIFVLGGMMLGAATLLAPRPEAFLAFLVPTGLGPTCSLLLQGGAMHTSMGLLTAIFTASTVVSTWRIYLTIERSIRLKFENDDLLLDLQKAINRAEGLNETLEHKVQERTAELQESTEQLRAEMERREQVSRELIRTQEALLKSEKLAVTARLAATMAHEINNPLAAITNLIYLLSPLQTDPQAQGYVATLEQQV